MLKWTTGNKKPIRHALCAAIKEEGVHKHAQRVLDNVRGQIRAEVARLRAQGIHAIDLSPRSRRQEWTRARRAYGLS